MLKNFKEKAPEPQHLLHVGNNLYWLRISMPFALDHINIWLIEEADGWVVIDTGPNTSKAKEQVNQSLALFVLMVTLIILA